MRAYAQAAQACSDTKSHLHGAYICKQLSYLP